MANKVFIMAQGQAARWGNRNNPKQIIPIGKHNTPIIVRTLSKIPSNYEVYVVAIAEIFTAVAQFNFTAVSFRDPGSLLKGIWLCHEYIEPDVDDVIFILGDVVFSNKMLNTIFSNRDNQQATIGKSGVKKAVEPVLFGRIGENKITKKEASELFALYIPKEHIKTFMTELKAFWISLFESNQPGKLWNLSREFDYKIVTIPGDYTDDIDSPQEFDKFYHALNIAAILDN